MPKDSQRQAGALSQPLKISPAMLDEGVDAYLSFDLESEEARTVVREIYLRMSGTLAKESGINF